MKNRIIIPILFLLIAATAVIFIIYRRGISTNPDSAEYARPSSDTSLSGMSEHDISVQASPEPEIPATEKDVKPQPSEIQVYETFGSGPLVRRYVYTYDEQGNMLTKNTYHMDSEEPSYTDVYTYDEQGRKLTYQYSDQYDHFELTEYIYDELGILTESLSYDKEKELSSRTVYTYDERGNILEEQYYDKDGNPVNGKSYEYTYDEDGRILTQKETYNQGSSNILFEYTYNEQGLLLTETWNFGNGITKFFEYSYDEQGILLEKQQYDNVSDPDGPLIKDGLFKYVY